MKRVKKTTVKNLKKRAKAFVKHVILDSSDAAVGCRAFDAMLDELFDEDYFGTEGQCDPRGDRRD